LQVKNVCVRYPNGTRALSDFSITVKTGEFVTVLGGNGSGKTTLLRCITRTVKPSSGEIWVNGSEMTEIEGEPLRRARLNLALISQHASLVRRRNVLANVATGSLGRHFNLWTALGGLPSEELEAGRNYLGKVGLASLEAQRASTLSGGQAQRVAIARALAQKPQVLLADEPVASLDPEAANEVMRLLVDLATNGRLAVLCVLHQVDLAYAYAHRVIGIRRGRVAFDRERADVSRAEIEQLYVGEPA